MSRPAKRQRTGGLPLFGAPSALGELETAIFQTNEPSSRNIITSVPSLITLFSLLSKSHPGLLTNEIIVTYFLRGPGVSISSSALPGANKNTVLAIPRLNAHVCDLDLTAFNNISDESFAKVISQLHSLRSLCLRKCSKVGARTLSAVVKSCPDIRRLNFNETSVSPGAIAELLVARGSELEVLKLAGLERWTDATFMAQLQPLIKEEQIKMSKLQTLKLRSLQLSDSSIDFLLSLCPNLRRLDMSFTATKRPFSFSSRRDIHAVSADFTPPKLEKLSLTSTPIGPSDLLQTISSFPSLQILSIGAVGAKGSIGVASAATLNDGSLQKLTVILQSFSNLRSVNMVSNTRLGISSQNALFNFIQQVGRQCLYLNLSGISSLRSGALAGFVPDEGMDPPALQTLVLNNTGIDDGAGAYIACCPHLVTLELEGTKVTSMCSR
ncbi:hypothetical protein GYMLUDRAFT_66419 [Collybiopsis luxurians FD-317 M1]|nr:hypothetical protein GYMLUDRAFT_66419 [Collybiopsis luxurians FD-317 M1]